MAGYSHFTPEQIAAAVQTYRDRPDMSRAEVARLHGVSQATLSRWVARANAQRGGVPAAVRQQAVREYMESKGEETMRQVAARHGVSQETLSKWLKAAGVSPRRHVRMEDESPLNVTIAHRWVGRRGIVVAVPVERPRAKGSAS